MFRKELIELLQDRPLSVLELAELLELAPKDVADDIEHLIKSLKHTDYRLRVTPARCRKCGFTFKDTKLRKPGKCPACHGTWIAEPRIRIEQSKN